MVYEIEFISSRLLEMEDTAGRLMMNYKSGSLFSYDVISQMARLTVIHV
jgi:hypothetical protein